MQTLRTSEPELGVDWHHKKSRCGKQGGNNFDANHHFLEDPNNGFV